MALLRLLLALLTAGVLFLTLPTRTEDNLRRDPREVQAEADRIGNADRHRAKLLAIEQVLAAKKPTDRRPKIAEMRGPSQAERQSRSPDELWEQEQRDAPDEEARAASNRRRLERHGFIPIPVGGWSRE